MVGVLVAASYDQYWQNDTFPFDNYDKIWDSYWGYLGVQGRFHVIGRLFVRGTFGVTHPLDYWSPSCTVEGSFSAETLQECNAAEFSGKTTAFFGAGLEVEVF